MNTSGLRIGVTLALIMLFSACVMVPPGQYKSQGKNESAPGQVMHKTGCNPASGKCKDN